MLVPERAARIIREAPEIAAELARVLRGLRSTGAVVRLPVHGDPCECGDCALLEALAEMLLP